MKITDSNNKLANYIFLGKNMGEAVCPTINILIKFSDNTNSNGDAIHQGNNMATIDSAYTNGCSAITAYELNIDTQTRETDVDRNYEAFKQSLIPYGYQGVKPNVYVW